MQDDARFQQIKARAHQLWEQNGRPDGRDRDHWYQAEREIGEAEILAGDERRLDEGPAVGKVKIAGPAVGPAKRVRRKSPTIAK